MDRSTTVGSHLERVARTFAATDLNQRAGKFNTPSKNYDATHGRASRNNANARIVKAH